MAKATFENAKNIAAELTAAEASVRTALMNLRSALELIETGENSNNGLEQRTAQLKATLELMNSALIQETFVWEGYRDAREN